MLPDELRREFETSALLVAPANVYDASIDVADIREAIRGEHRLGIMYRDNNDAETERIIWPFALGFFQQSLVVPAWCELRNGFRHFRADRMVSLAPTKARYPRPRHALLAEWRAREKIELQPEP